MQKLHSMLVSFLKSALLNVPYEGISPELLTENEMGDLINIASKNDVLQIVSDVIVRDSLISDDELMGIFKLSARNAFVRTENTLCEYNILTKALEDAKVPFIPLKGSVIRNLYPKEWYRTSCDIDILVREEDIQRAREYVEDSLGYTYDKEASHDISFFTKSGVHIELHFSLIEENSLHLGDRRKWNAQPLCSVWQSATVKDGWGYFYELSPEIFYIYHIAHMAKHFESGGCGLRTICDLWLIESVYSGDVNKRDSLLKDCGLDKFSSYVSYLAKVWFGDEEHTDITLFLERYIISGGVYGNVDNNITYKQNKKGGKLGYIFYRIFMPYDVLKFIYPSLQKHKWMYSFYTVRRWVERLLFGKKVKKSLKELTLVSKGDLKEKSAHDYLEEIGL